MKFLFLFCIVLLFQNVWAMSVCMDIDSYEDSIVCRKSRVIRKIINGKTYNAINTKLGIIIDAKNVNGFDDLLDIFLDFDSWDEYAEREGSGVVVFESSQKLPSIEKDGHVMLRHYANFGTKAPAPLYRQWVRTVINYWQIPDKNKSMVAYRFMSDHGTNIINGDNLLVGTEGMRHYEGFFYIFYISETSEYIVYTEFILVPPFDILASFAIPSIERGLTVLVKGMFGL